MAESSIDRLADELAHWAIDFSDKIAAAIQGGVHAPNSAHLTEQQKLDYYTRQFFDAAGAPNLAGRAQEMQRLGPEGFGETFAAVLKAHPEYKQPAQSTAGDWAHVTEFQPPGAPAPMPNTGNAWASVLSYTPPDATEPTYVNPQATEAQEVPPA
jgi:hypothetical protein